MKWNSNWAASGVRLQAAPFTNGFQMYRVFDSQTRIKHSILWEFKKRQEFTGQRCTKHVDVYVKNYFKELKAWMHFCRKISLFFTFLLNLNIQYHQAGMMPSRFHADFQGPLNLLSWRFIQVDFD